VNLLQVLYDDLYSRMMLYSTLSYRKFGNFLAKSSWKRSIFSF